MITKTTLQHTISGEISLKGVGLHTGADVLLNFKPAPENTGFVFVRTDLNPAVEIPADALFVVNTDRGTNLEKDGVKIQTSEHVLAALVGYGIDNCYIELNSSEPPIMDGSSRDFLTVLSETNLINQTKKRKYLKISDKIELVDGEKKISIEPHNSLEVDFQLKYENKIIGKQKNIIDFQKDDLKDVSSSRTFCLFEDIEKIKKNGLAKGGSLENAVVVNKDKILNDGGLRNDKEFVNHKILDLSGDFILSGHRILGKVICYQGGHELTNLFLRKIFNTTESFKFIELSSYKIPKKVFTKESEKIAVNA